VFGSITDTTNFFLNLMTVVVIVVGFWAAHPVCRGKRAGQAIEDLEHALNAAAEAHRRGRGHGSGGQGRGGQVPHRSGEWKTRYEEARRYTAREAVEHFEAMMADHSNKVAERHERMLKHLEIQTEASRNLAELIGHNTTIVAAIAERVGIGESRSSPSSSARSASSPRSPPSPAWTSTLG
jgi:hypothetical protein